MIGFGIRLRRELYRKIRVLRGNVRQHGIFWFLNRLLPYIIVLLLAVLLRIVLWTLKPLVHFRFGPLGTRALGGFALNPELYLCERDANLRPTKGFDVMDFFDGDGHSISGRSKFRDTVSNYQLSVMWERKIRVSRVARSEASTPSASPFSERENS